MRLSFEEVALKITPVPEHNNFVNKSGMQVFKLKVLFFTGMTESKSPVATFACQCDCGNYKIISTGNLRVNDPRATTSCGCHRIKERNKVASDAIPERVKRLEDETPYKVVDPKSGAYDSKWILKCSKHGEFSSSWGNVVIKGTKCPSCACIGRGFNQMIPGLFYFNRLIDSGGNTVAFKYGVTNSTAEKRRTWLQFGTDYKIENVLSFKFVRGEHALKLERDFSKTFGKNFLLKEDLLVGFSETVSPDLETNYLEWIDSYIKSSNHSPN